MFNKVLKVLALVLVFSFGAMYAHEGHFHPKADETSVHPTSDGEPSVKHFGGRPADWMQWVGGFHFVLLHFPIALINMVVLAELLYARSRKTLYRNASTFMLVLAAILIVPTAIFGLIYSYTGVYEGLLNDFLYWHMYLGISSVVLTLLTLYLYYKQSNAYYWSLAALFLFVNATAALGGGMTFGPYHFLPPAL